MLAFHILSHTCTYVALAVHDQENAQLRIMQHTPIDYVQKTHMCTFCYNEKYKCSDLSST